VSKFARTKPPPEFLHDSQHGLKSEGSQTCVLSNHGHKVGHKLVEKEEHVFRYFLLSTVPLESFDFIDILNKPSDNELDGRE
jgi:hypothetical protein